MFSRSVYEGILTRSSNIVGTLALKRRRLGNRSRRKEQEAQGIGQSASLERQGLNQHTNAASVHLITFENEQPNHPLEHSYFQFQSDIFT